MEAQSHIVYLYNIRQSRNQIQTQYYLVSCSPTFLTNVVGKQGKHHISISNQNAVIIYDVMSTLKDRESGKFEVSFRSYKGGIQLIAKERITYERQDVYEFLPQHYAPYNINPKCDPWSVEEQLISDVVQKKSDIFVVEIYDFEWMETLSPSVGPGVDIYLVSVNGSFMRNVVNTLFSEGKASLLSEGKASLLSEGKASLLSEEKASLLSDTLKPRSGRRNRIYVTYSCHNPCPGTYGIRFQMIADKEGNNHTIAYIEDIYMKAI